MVRLGIVDVIDLVSVVAPEFDSTVGSCARVPVELASLDRSNSSIFA
jgi:hypothetical protein